MKRWIICGLMALVFAGMCVMENAAQESRPTQPTADKTSSLCMLAGEFRTVFANLLWIKVDKYHHEFIQHNPDWSQNQELIGLLNVITKLDPHFIEAYADAAYLYADGMHDNKKALAVLHQGVTSNPRSRELYTLLAVMHAGRMKDPQAGLPYAKLALKYSEDNWYRTRCQRLLNTILRDIADKEKH